MIANGYLRLNPQEWIRAVEKRRSALGRQRHGFSRRQTLAPPVASCDNESMLGWAFIGVVAVAIVVGWLLLARSLRRWRQPPPGRGPDAERARSALDWLTFSQGDQSGGA